MITDKLVSIIIPAYKATFFEESLLSAVNQIYSNIEIIICDDSQDSLIANIIERVQENTSRTIGYYPNETRLMEIGNVSRCVALSKGDYIKFLYDDDLLHPECVSSLVAAMEADPDITLASSKRQRIDEFGRILADNMATSYPFRGDVTIHGGDLIDFFANNIINFIGEPSCVLCRGDDLREYADSIFLLNGQRMRYLADMALYIKLLHKGNVAFLAKPLSSFRVSSEQVSQLAASEMPIVQDTYRRFPEAIRQLGWYSGRKDTEEVRVAALGYSDSFISVNLMHALNSALHISEGSRAAKSHAEWLAEREFSPLQQIERARYEKSISQRAVLTVFISTDGTDSSQARAIFEQISSWQHPLLTINAVPINAAQASGGNIPRAINATVAADENHWLMFMAQDDEFLTSGLMALALLLPEAPHCVAIFGDLFFKDREEISSSACRPDFNLDLLLSHPSLMASHWLFRSDKFVELGGFDANYDRQWQFAYILNLIEQGMMGNIGHMAEPLVLTPAYTLTTDSEYIDVIQGHITRRGYEHGRVEESFPGLYAIKYAHASTPLVSIIVPTKDQLPVLITCVTSLIEKTRYQNYELIIVDNNSETAEAKNWLEGLSTVDPERIRVLRYPYPFNYSAINNFAAAQAKGEYLVLLNNDTAVISEQWLDNLLNHAQRPEVGITGAKLLYPDGKIQHAGVVLGLRGPAEHPFIGCHADEAGYMQRLRVDQNYSAVTAACLMIRKSIYEEVGGLDEEAFKVSYNDVDLCLKVRNAGYFTVWTPHAVVMHEGSVSQKKVDKAAFETKRQRFVGEQKAFYSRWLPLIGADPAYNANLSLSGSGFQLEQDRDICWQPLSWKPIPRVMSVMADYTGCGQYRIIQPWKAMHNAGLIEGKLSDSMLDVPEILRLNVDSIVLQRQITPEAHEWLDRVSVINSLFKVMELDDYLPNLPLKNAHRQHMPKDIMKAIRKSLSMVDRFVVSTERLAEAFKGLHGDIQVVENRLPPLQWSNLSSRRNTSAKPRVGWAGGGSHTGDLEMIADVVKAYADRVDWVFFGMCPPKLRPYVKEFHAGVTIDNYPQKLAALNLDLALAPVEDNTFSQCKSNLRLLEYGACSYPVICSDVACYQTDLPVTRVKNRFKDWCDAIEMHLADPQASALMGKALNQAVKDSWMLEGQALTQWAMAWLPN